VLLIPRPNRLACYKCGGAFPSEILPLERLLLDSIERSKARACLRTNFVEKGRGGRGKDDDSTGQLVIFNSAATTEPPRLADTLALELQGKEAEAVFRRPLHHIIYHYTITLRAHHNPRDSFAGFVGGKSARMNVRTYYAHVRQPLFIHYADTAHQ